MKKYLIAAAIIAAVSPAMAEPMPAKTFYTVYNSFVQTVPIRLTQTPTRASVGHHGGHGHPPARRSGFSPVAP
jgi:hypothetical protein